MTGRLDELQDEFVPARGSFKIWDMQMNAAALQTLRELRSLGNIEAYLRAARTELASDPSDDTLRAFVELVEGLLRDERAKLATA